MSRFTRRSTKRALLTIAAEYAIITGAITIAVAVPETGWPVTALAILVIGTRQYALGEALLHEASHWHLSSSKPVNDLLGAILAWPVFTSLAAFRRFHNRQHHGLDIADSENSIWQDYDLPGSALTAPAATRIGQKLELGGWVYVSSNFDGRFYLEINSIDSRGAKTNIARTNPSVDATAASGEVPRNRWIYITTEPASGQDSRVLPSTRRISVAFAVHDATGDIYFDRAVLGSFARGSHALGDASPSLICGVTPGIVGALLSGSVGPPLAKNQSKTSPTAVAVGTGVVVPGPLMLGPR